MADSVLTERQEVLLREFFRGDAERHGFFLTGGTALAGFYLQHRFSEDLDFFTRLEGEIPWAVLEFERVTANLDGDVQWSRKENEFAEGFVSIPPYESPDVPTKIHFAQDVVNSRLHEPLQRDRIVVDSILDIAVNKVLCVYGREEMKDFVDLFFILNETSLTLDALISLVDRKEKGFDPLRLAAQMSRLSPEWPRPRMAKPLRWDELFKRFDREAKRLATQGRPPSG